jgi:hypothetical protein
MGDRKQVGIGLSYRPARPDRLAEFIPFESIPGLHERLKIRAQAFTLETCYEVCRLQGHFGGCVGKIFLFSLSSHYTEVRGTYGTTCELYLLLKVL